MKKVVIITDESKRSRVTLYLNKSNKYLMLLDQESLWPVFILYIPNLSRIVVPDCPHPLSIMSQECKLVQTNHSCLTVARGPSEIYSYSFDPNDCASFIEEISEDADSSYKLTRFTVSDTVTSTRFESYDLASDQDDSSESEHFSPPKQKQKSHRRTELKVLEDLPLEMSNFRYRVVKLGISHSQFSGPILSSSTVESQMFNLPEDKFPAFYRYLSGECLIDLKKGKFVQFDFQKQFSFIHSMKDNITSAEIENLYKFCINFKQSCFELMELKLNFSEIIVRLGLDSKLDSYLKAVCYFNRKIGPELSGNRNMVLTWNVSSGVRAKKQKPEKASEEFSINRTFVEESAIWPSIAEGENLENRLVLNALEYCFLKGKAKKDSYELLKESPMLF